jgi:hypothetical protein
MLISISTTKMACHTGHPFPIYKGNFSEQSGISADKRDTKYYFNEYMKKIINLIIDYFVMKLIYGTVLEEIDDVKFLNCILCAKKLGFNNLEYDESHIEKLSDYIIENHLMYGGNLVYYDNYIKEHSHDEIIKLIATAFVSNKDDDDEYNSIEIHSIISIIDYMETYDLDVEVSPYKNDHPVGNALKSFILMYIIESNENSEINSELKNIYKIINFCHTHVHNVYVNKICLLLFEHYSSFRCHAILKKENQCGDLYILEFFMKSYNSPLIQKLVDIDNPTYDQICFYSHQFNLQDSDFSVAQLIEVLYGELIPVIHDDKYFKPCIQHGKYYEGFEHLAGPPLISRFINFVPNTQLCNFTYVKSFVPNSPFHIVKAQFKRERDGVIVHSFKCNKINNGKITYEPCDGIGHICFLENNFHEIYEDSENYELNFLLVSYLIMC